MNADARGWRMALVPEALINPPDRDPAALPDVLGILTACGYGVLQLPPPGQHGLLLAVIADQVTEYAHHGYAVVAIGVAGRSRRTALAPPGPAAAASGRGGPRRAISSGRPPTPRTRGGVPPPSSPATICRSKNNAAGVCSMNSSWER